MRLPQWLRLPDRKGAWRAVRDRRGSRLVSGGFWGQDALQEELGDWTVTLFQESTDDSTATVVCAPFANPSGLRFSITRTHLLSGLARMLGFQDHEIGHRAFDRAFVIKANDWRRVEDFLGNRRVRDLIARQKKGRFELRGGARLFGRPYPVGIDELRFHWPGTLVDVDRLCDLFELFDESLHQLCYGGRSRSNNLDAHVFRLSAPSGRGSDKHVTWDGDRPRRRAAAALAMGRTRDPRAVEALVGVLEDEDDELRGLAIDALARIGDTSALPPLIRLLGDGAGIGRARVRDLAADAVRSLGAPQIVDALGDALAGDVETLRARVGPFRDASVDALARALEGGSAAGAAAGLQELGAREALPVLRAAARERHADPEVRDAIERVIGELEARASLPRAAGEGEKGAPTLPRRARPPTGADGLPRPAGSADPTT